MGRLSIAPSLAVLLVLMGLTLERPDRHEPDAARDLEPQKTVTPPAEPLPDAAPPVFQMALVLPPPPQTRQAPPERLKPAPAPQADITPMIPTPNEPVEKDNVGLEEINRIVPLTPAVDISPEKHVVPLRPNKETVRPRPGRQAEEKPVTAVKSESANIISRPAPEAAKRGRILLRMLEHGSGPSITISWPETRRHQDRLYDVLTHCYGMEAALMDTEAALFSVGSGEARQWTPNLDRYSGFIRQITGATTDEESLRIKAAKRVRAKGVLTPVRIFRRQFDGLLLGGLIQVSEGRAASAQQIEARYRLTGRRLSVENIHVDGKPVPGRINLASLARCREDT